MSQIQPEQQPRRLQELPLNQLEAESGTDLDPIRYFRNKNNPTERYVRLLSPDSNLPIVVKLPEKCQDERLKSYTETWDNIKDRVMLDPSSLRILIEILSRISRNKKQPLFIEGPPAVSKTFLIWVAACIMEMPYVRVSFSGGSTESSFIGSQQPNTEFRLKRTLEEILGSSAIQRTIDRIVKKPVQRRTHVEKEKLEIVELLQEGLVNNLTNEEMMVEIMMLEHYFKIKIIDDKNYVWRDHPMIWAVEAGGVIAFDEINTVRDTRVLDILLSFLDVNTSTIHVSGSRPRPVKKHPDSIIVGAQNPASVKGRQPLPSATLSRVDSILLPAVTEEFVTNLLEFFIYGNDPKMLIKGKVRRGRTNVNTDFRALEVAPLADAIIKTITNIFITIVGLIDKHEIGTNQAEGGNYVFDQRKIYSFLNAIISTANHRTIIEEGDTLQYEDINWSKVIKEAMRQVFLSGMSGSETTGDYARVKAIIDNNPLWKLLDKQRPGIPSYVGGGMSGNVKDGKFTPDFL